MANMYLRTRGAAGSVGYHVLEYALAQGLGKLRKDLVVTRLIDNRSAQAKAKGSRYGENLRVPKRGSGSAQTKTPGTAATPQALTDSTADIALNTHKTWDILVEDYGSLFTQKGLLSGYLQDGAGDIAEAIETAVIANYASAGGTVGSAGGNASSTLVRTVRLTSRGASYLFSQSEPTYMVWGINAEYDLLGVALFVQADQSGRLDALEKAKLGNKLGVEHFSSNMIAAVAGSPGAEHNMCFQKDGMAIAFVDMGMEDIPSTYTAGVMMKSMSYNDDEGNPIYQMRSIIGYDQLERGTVLTVDTIFGTGVVRSEHLIDVLT